MSSQIIRHAVFAMLLLAALLPVWLQSDRDPVAFQVLKPVELASGKSEMKMGFACADCIVPSVHGANVVETGNGNLLATWFGGSREGGRDVAIWAADYSVAKQQWNAPRRVLAGADLQAALGRHIKTVGNSLLLRGAGGELKLFFVSVSVGGWAGSSLNVAQSHDEGKTWQVSRRLVTSPFFNVSTLVKTAPVEYVDGSIGLPVYHEFIGKFAEMLRLDQHGNVLDKYRLTSGRRAIQPAVIALDAQHAVALMRDTGSAPGAVLLGRSDDGGRHWSDFVSTELPNPDSAVAGLRRPDGSLLLVLNDLQAGRHSLALAISRDDGRHWRVVRHFEQDSQQNSEFSYPYLIRTADGMMHLVYTWNRKQIRHVAFNDGWVDAAGSSK